MDTITYILIVLTILFLLYFIYKILPIIKHKMRPNPEDLKDLCPHCGAEIEKTRRYCMACGGQIWTNVLSEDDK